jgi:hypothetical protein
MKDLKFLLNQTTSEIQEIELCKAIKKMHDLELKKEITIALKKDFGLFKNEIMSGHAIIDQSNQKKSNLRIIRNIISIAAIFLILMFGFLYFNSENSSLELANQYAFAEIINHPGLTKGLLNDEQTEVDAIKLFNAMQWNEASIKFESVAKPTDATLFYSAMSYFYNKNYSAAIALFQNKHLSNSVFNQEVNWYLGLAYLLNNQANEASIVLSKIQPNDWKYKEARKLLK